MLKQRFNKTDEQVEQWAKDHPPPGSVILTEPQAHSLPRPDPVKDDGSLWWLRK